MRSRIHAIVLPSETSDFATELPEVFLELGREADAIGMAGECAPPLDVFETDEAVEIAMDLPGVPKEAVRIVAKGTMVLIAGEKMPRRGQGYSSFHLVERGYGRFARTVRVSSACDVAQARAALTNGELRLTIPKRTDRRNQPIHIPIAGERPVA
ncbi:MAG: Hsp20/alpha crystallin family protein [Acidobacteriaceae bacterium]|nr:Hsp20/alpha crystallin family protein [Acidobacteriaceae bacterium]